MPSRRQREALPLEGPLEKMDVGVDEARQDQTAAEVDLLGSGPGHGQDGASLPTASMRPPPTARAWAARMPGRSGGRRPLKRIEFAVVTARSLG